MSRSPVAFGPYVITRRIARGGMAEIYRARTRSQPGGGGGRWVAVKMMRPALGHEELRENLFKREARIASMIHHPNVVELYEFGREMDRHYLAMEYMRGRDLSHLIRGSKGTKDLLPCDLSLFIGWQAAAGLGYAHRLIDDEGKPLAIIHRDISPGNVIVNYDGLAKVLDFGVARMNETQGLRTQTGTLRGKFAYMSPEQTLGESIDARSDVFSLGTLLYELLTGSNPFRTKAPIQTLERVQRVRPAPPSRANRRVPKEVDTILARCLAKDPRRRYRDALEVHDALGHYLERTRTDHRAQLAKYMGDRFAWERQEEEIELTAEEDEVALLEVVDFSLSANDPALDAPRVTVSHEEEASQQEVNRSNLVAAEDEESEFGVFDGRSPTSGIIPEPAPEDEPLDGEPTGGISARSILEEGTMRMRSPERGASGVVPRELSGSGENNATVAMSRDKRPLAPSRQVSAAAAASTLETTPVPVAPDRVGSLREAPPREISQASDPMLLALVEQAPLNTRRPPPTAERTAVDRRRDDSDAFGSGSGRKLFLAAAGAVVVVIVLIAALTMRPDKPAEVASKPPRTETKIAPVTIEIAPTEPERSASAAAREDPTPVTALEPQAVRVEPETEEPETDAPETDEPDKPEPTSLAVAEPEEIEPAERKPVTKPEPRKAGSDSKPTRAKRASKSTPKSIAKTKSRPKRPQVGYLNVRANPWAEIVIDGKRWPYLTPQGKIELDAGRHVVRLYNPETKVTKTETVYIKAGSERNINADMQR